MGTTPVWVSAATDDRNMCENPRKWHQMAHFGLRIRLHNWFEYESKESDAPKVKKVKEKAPKKKRVLSEEHKQKLALARQKALEVRRANSKQKKEMKELTKLKKQQELEKLREETGTKKTTQHNQKKVVDTPSAVEASPPSMVEIPKSQPVSIPKQPSQIVGYSQADLDKATLNAIMGYEKIRKKRKEAKKQEEKERIEQEALKKQLREITTKQKPTYETNPWSDFF